MMIAEVQRRLEVKLVQLEAVIDNYNIRIDNYTGLRQTALDYRAALKGSIGSLEKACELVVNDTMPVEPAPLSWY